LALAVSAMAVSMIRAGVQVNIGEMIMFPVLTLIGIEMMAVLLRNVLEPVDTSA